MLEIPKGDYGFYLNFTVYDNDDTSMTSQITPLN